MAKQSIKNVAKFGVTPILINPLANNWIKGLNMNLNRYLEGINNIKSDVFIILITDILNI